jgi:hypothetical protein
MHELGKNRYGHHSYFDEYKHLATRFNRAQGYNREIPVLPWKWPN